MTKHSPPSPHGPNRPRGIGASLTRRKDDRFMRVRGKYVGNICMVDVGFVRSPVARGQMVGIEKPTGFEDAVYMLADLDGVKPIVANSGLPDFKSSERLVLAGAKMRQVGAMLTMADVAPAVSATSTPPGRFGLSRGSR